MYYRNILHSILRVNKCPIVFFVTSEEKLILTNVRFVARVEGERYKHIRQNRFSSLVPNYILTSFVTLRKTKKYVFRACVVKTFLKHSKKLEI